MEQFGRFIGLMIVCAIIGGTFWAIVTGAFWVVIVALIIVGLFGVVLKIAGWGMSQ